MFSSLHSSGIRLLERYFRTDIRYLLGGSFWLSASSLVGIGVAFFLSILYARYLPKDIYGNYRYVLSLVSIAGVLSLPGLGTAITRAVARGLPGTFRNCARIIFLSSFGISIICLVTALLLYTRGNKETALGLVIASIIVPFVEGMGSWRAYLDGKKDFKKKTIWNAIVHGVYGIAMTAIIATIYIFKTNTLISIALLVGTYLLAHALPNIIFFFMTRKTIAPNAPSDADAIPYGLHLSLSGVPATIATYLDSVLLFHFLGPAHLAIYSFAIAVPEQLKRLFTNISDVTFPKLAAFQRSSFNDQQHIKKILPPKLFKASLITSFIIIVYIAVAPLLYSFFFPRYVESIPLSQIFALSLR